MDLQLNEDARSILTALDGLCRRHEAGAHHPETMVSPCPDLERDIIDAGFLDVAADSGLGAYAGALVVERLARSPFAMEVAASALIGPALGQPVAYPLCLLDQRRSHRPIRYLRDGATLLTLGDAVTRGTVAASDVRAEPDALYACPVGTLIAPPADTRILDIAPETVLVRWRVGLAAEVAGLLRGALDSCCAHVAERKQFGRPLGTFQAVRHRLAQAQVRTDGVYWLAMKAAATLDPGDAALAAFHAQESARDCIYDFHQFLGAMGMTLEHPLHLWTYRLKLLLGDLGGASAQARDAAALLWDDNGQVREAASKRNEKDIG